MVAATLVAELGISIFHQDFLFVAKVAVMSSSFVW
jgi:hypothetical protein